MALDPELLAILVCPMTRTPLRYDAAAGELVSEAAGLAYPVREGVPVMLVEEARRIGELNRFADAYVCSNGIEVPGARR